MTVTIAITISEGMILDRSISLITFGEYANKNEVVTETDPNFKLERMLKSFML